MTFSFHLEDIKFLTFIVIKKILIQLEFTIMSQKQRAIKKNL